MDFESALAYLQSLQKFGIKLGNERFEALDDLLDELNEAEGRDGGRNA